MRYALSLKRFCQRRLWHWVSKIFHKCIVVFVVVAVQRNVACPVLLLINVAIGPLKQPLLIFKFQTSNFLLIEILVKIINPFPQNRQQ